MWTVTEAFDLNNATKNDEKILTFGTYKATGLGLYKCIKVRGQQR